MFGKIISNDPLVKLIKGKTSTTRRRKSTRRKSGGSLTASEKRIVNAVSRRVKTRKRVSTTRRR